VNSSLSGVLRLGAGPLTICSVPLAREIAPSPAQLTEAGWGRKRSETALAPGTVITIALWPSRAGMDAHAGLVQKLVNSAGETVLGTIALNPA